MAPPLPQPNAELLRLATLINRNRSEKGTLSPSEPDEPKAEKGTLSPPPAPVSEESLLSQIGNTGLSAIGAAGNALDLLGSSVRDVLAFENPFDQWLSPFSGENRTSGRGLLEKWGILGANKETGMSGWLTDPAEGASDLAGFAAELALDPLAWLTGGATTAAKQAAKKSAWYTPGVLGGLDRFGPEISDVLTKVDPGTYVGRAINATLPEGQTLNTVLTGLGKKARNAPGVSKVVDKAAPVAAAVLSKATLHAKQAFDHRVRDAITEVGQDASRLHSDVRHAMETEWQGEIVPVIHGIADTLTAQGGDAQEYVAQLGRTMRDALEDKGEVISAARLDELPVEIHEPMQRLKQYQQTILQQAQRAGVKVSELEDEMVGFAHRQMSDYVKDYLNQQANFGTKSGRGVGPQAVSSREHQASRVQLFKDSRTNVLNEALSDSEIHDLLEDGLIDEAAAMLESRYAHGISPEMKLTNHKSGDFQMLNQAGETVEISGAELKNLETVTDAALREGDTVTWSAVPGQEFRVESIVPGEAGDVAILSDGSRARVAELENLSSRTVYQKLDEDGVVLDSFEHLTGSRYEALAEHMVDMPVYRDTGGLFTNHTLADLQSGFRAASHAIANAKSTTDILVDGFRSGILSPKAGRGKAITLKEFLDDQAFSILDRDHVYSEMARRNPNLLGDTDETVDLAEILDDITIDPEVARDLRRSWEFRKAGPDTPGVQGAISNAFRSMTALFKAGVLTAPARYFRDLVSGQVANVYNNMYSNTAARSAWKAMFKQPDEYLMQIPEVAKYAADRGMELTPETATRAVREMYAARRGHASSLYRDLDNPDTILDSASDFDEMSRVLPGGYGSFREAVKETGATLAGRRGGNFNPLNVAGFNRKGKTTFAPVQAGDIVGKHSDDMNRMVGFIELMRQGETADDAMQAVNRVQLNYDPRTFSTTEQAFKKVFPFWSFASRQAAYVGTELMQNPAGRLGKLIRAIRHSQDEEEYLPEHVRNQMAVKVGDPKADGTQNYLTGLGLMFEDTLNTFVPSSTAELGRSLLSKSNPIIKGPVEWAMGASSFQGGPLGGRSLHDMDPVIGRIFTQLGLQTPLPGGQAAPAFGSRGLEFIASNSPVSRLLSSARTAVDNRKNLLERSANLLTGLRVTSVSPQQQRRGLRDVTDALARDLGSRPFETFHISDELIEQAGEGTEAQKTLLAIKELRRLWDRKRKAEKREKENVTE